MTGGRVGGTEPPPARERPHSRRRDIGWAVFAAFWALNALAAVVAAIHGAFIGDFDRLLTLVPALLASYWLGVGGWRRTSWASVGSKARPEPVDGGA